MRESGNIRNGVCLWPLSGWKHLAGEPRTGYAGSHRLVARVSALASKPMTVDVAPVHSVLGENKAGIARVWAKKTKWAVS